VDRRSDKAIVKELPAIERLVSWVRETPLKLLLLSLVIGAVVVLSYFGQPAVAPSVDRGTSPT
jgi:hypothetical protein